MPITCGNFIDLANGGFYDNVHFHRVIPNFMNQFGCPHARDPLSPEAGTGGPPAGSKFTACNGQTYTRNQDGGIPDEVGEAHQEITNGAGTLSMGAYNRDRNTIRNDAIHGLCVCVCVCVYAETSLCYSVAVIFLTFVYSLSLFPQPTLEHLNQVEVSSLSMCEVRRSWLK
jgi:hypothetical protein